MARISGVSVTTVSVAEALVLDGVTGGTVTASKALVVDSNKDLSALRTVVVTNLDAGASGTAGTVDIFPTTASKGKTQITATANAGDTTTTITNAAQTTTATMTIPDTNGSASFVMTAATQTVGGAKTFSSAIVPTGGVAAAGGFSATARCIHTGGNPAMISTDGTNLSAVVTEMYVAEVFIPANCTVTGAAVFWGDATEGNAKVALFNSAGTRVALSASTDVSGFTGDSYGTRIAFSAPYAAVGPATYYVGVICDSSSNRINTHILGNFGAGKIESLVYATEAGYATITPPTTFTTGLGPIATLY
jgi:hypothetical protein